MINRVLKRVRRLLPSQAPAVLDYYVANAPDPQNALDIFKGEWTSRLPAPYSELRAGQMELFDDGRIHWLQQECGGLAGKHVLELGPLEGAHSYMLEKFGAESITAVEANTRAYLRCLLVKDLLTLKRVRFECGDCVEYLKQKGPAFDICVASGVLYHMRDPVELIQLLAQRCKQQVLIWTHYYDAKVIGANLVMAQKYTTHTVHETAGFKHTLHRQEYRGALGWGGFCGGSASYSNWLSREDILGALSHFGFTNVRFNFDHPNHPNGPAVALIADRA